MSLLSTTFVLFVVMDPFGNHSEPARDCRGLGRRCLESVQVGVVDHATAVTIGPLKLLPDAREVW
jgi:hypothetical protein